MFLAVERGMVRPDDVVTLHVPENPRLDGQKALVRTVAEWGAFVETRAAATHEFRALWEEMLVEMPDPVDLNPTGEVCCTCGGSRMVRSGACMVCLDCGTSGGCS